MLRRNGVNCAPHAWHRYTTVLALNGRVLQLRARYLAVGIREATITEPLAAADPVFKPVTEALMLA